VKAIQHRGDKTLDRGLEATDVNCSRLEVLQRRDAHLGVAEAVRKTIHSLSTEAGHNKAILVLAFHVEASLDRCSLPPGCEPLGVIFAVSRMASAAFSPIM
jgi:hypothetical protein